MPSVGDRVAYQSITGEHVAYDAIVRGVEVIADEKLFDTRLALDVVIPGCGAPLARTRVPWSPDPACRTRGWAHPKEIDA